MLDPVRVLVYETKTGSVLGSVPFSSVRWSDTLNEAGGHQVVVPMGREARPWGLRALTRPWLRSLAVVRGADEVLQAGPVTARSWDPSSQELTLTAKGGWALMDKRLTLDSDLRTQWVDGSVLIDDDHPADKYELTLGGSLASIAIQLVTSSSDWEALPIDERPLSGSSSIRHYLATDMRTIGECLSNLTKVTGGPELAFRPYLSGDTVRFDFVGGSPELVSTEWVWNAAVPGSRVVLSSLDEDGSEMTNQAYQLGGRTDDVVLVCRRTNQAMLNAGYPLLQSADSSHSTVSVLSTLAEHAQGLLDVGGQAQESFELKVGAEYRVRAGDHASVYVEDPYLGSVTLDLKIAEVTGDTGEWLTVSAVLQ